ncbi:hypothetical protein [Ekhidna sp.]|uniref:hypothetical protein n=1 Tax=Ekhidna sp. TaxID=2608089 RepID=UPI00329812D5
MKISPDSRALKMIIHLVSIYIFSVPITTHILKLALNETFCINEACFDDLQSLLLIFFILLIVSTNIYSIVTDSKHKLAMLVTGGFLSAVTMIQLVVILFDVEMEVFSRSWETHISIIEACITGTFSIILLVAAAYIKDTSLDGHGHAKAFDIKVNLSVIVAYINGLDRRIAFLLGIFTSIVVAIPSCAVLYLLGGVLLDENMMNSERMKLLGWIGIVGMQGSVISMLLSLRRFEKIANNTDNISLFINALVRPFIGLSFAHLTFFMLESGLLQDSNLGNISDRLKEGNGLIYSFNYHVSIAFIAGFTERIARVIQPGQKDTSAKKEDAD